MAGSLSILGMAFGKNGRLLLHHSHPNILYRSSTVILCRHSIRIRTCYSTLTNSSSKSIVPPYRILFFGSDLFSAYALSALYDKYRQNQLISHIEVVTPPDKSRGKNKLPEPIYLKKWALERNLVVHDAPLKTLKGWDPPQTRDKTPFDLAVVVSFGYFLPKDLIRSFPLRAMNVHPSLLPKYRGAAPIEYTILNGDKEAGVSIIELHEERFDAGRILAQQRFPISENVFYKDLHGNLGNCGAKLLVEAIENINDFQETAIPQDEVQVSKAPKIEKEMASIHWKTLDAADVWRLHRAIGFRFPLHTTFRGKRLQLTSIAPVDASSSSLKEAAPGMIRFGMENLNHTQHSRHEHPCLYVCCRDSTWVVVDKVKVEGKKEVAIKDFCNGYKVVDGEFFV